ncbi:MAG TPA: glycosyl hydrolase [Herpetosiphonaceae bacterium]
MQEGAASTSELRWPTISDTCRPWTRWWWLGSAVDEAEITRQLRLFQAAGFGGVELSPIYGVVGEEARSIPFLSPRWIEMLRHTVREARRLGLDVDMICGTGWPLGGPWVGPEDAAARCLFERYTVREEARVTEPIVSREEPQAALQALMAFSHDGQVRDLREHVDARRRLVWTAPTGQWTLYALFQAGTGQQVKRAAPGGEGNVVDHFSATSIERYLDRFDRAFADLPAEERVRCFFNDSYEVYGANWTAALLPQFERRRGYDLRRDLPALFGEADAEIVRRVRSDYRQTIADLLLEHFVEPWTAWAHRGGAMTRNQAHGSPGNLLDLYAAADIPETEAFGTDWLRLAGLTPLPGTPAGYGGAAEILACKLASSAAHVAGKWLCSSEACTWLGEHGTVPLAHIKAEIDLLFVMGINHVVFHGTPFSPADADWPGWMFYATTHIGPTNPSWRDLPALNAYISRCQSFLQAGQPDNDLLLYLPIFDLWAADHDAPDLLRFLTPHNTRDWLDESLPDFTATARRLWDRGYSFDCVSDRLLEDAIHVVEGQIRSRGGAYAALIVAGCRYIPPETLERIGQLARHGATIVVVGDLPEDVPGLGNLAERREQLRRVLSDLGPLQPIGAGIYEARLDQGRLLVGADVEALLHAAGIRRERIVDAGIELIRRRDDDGYLYFMTNPTQQRLNQWVSLSIRAASAIIFDPASQRHGIARTRTGSAETQIYLQLEPGESLLLRARSQPTDGPQWPYLAPAGPSLPIAGAWHVDFIAGGPALPAPRAVQRLSSWTEWPDDTEILRAFSGTARYTITFERPASSADTWAIDLRNVCYSARLRLNGADLGTCYARPFRVLLPVGLIEGRNHLEIEVTNLMANRLAALDRQGRGWRRFFFVSITYQEFSAADWEPLPSGLLGPVRLVPLRRLPSM